MPDEAFVITEYDREEDRVYIETSEPVIVADRDAASDLALDIMDKGIREWPSPPTSNVVDLPITDWKRKFPPNARHTKTTSLYDQEEDQVYFAMSQTTAVMDRDRALHTGLDLLKKSQKRPPPWRRPAREFELSIVELPDFTGPPECWPEPRVRRATAEELEAYKRGALTGNYTTVPQRSFTPEEVEAFALDAKAAKRRSARLHELIDRYIGISNFLSVLKEHARSFEDFIEFVESVRAAPEGSPQ
jgi:hypothetical protein